MLICMEGSRSRKYIHSAGGYALVGLHTYTITYGPDRAYNLSNNLYTVACILLTHSAICNEGLGLRVSVGFRQEHIAISSLFCFLLVALTRCGNWLIGFGARPAYVYGTHRLSLVWGTTRSLYDRWHCTPQPPHPPPSSWFVHLRSLYTSAGNRHIAGFAKPCTFRPDHSLFLHVPSRNI